MCHLSFVVRASTNGFLGLHGLLFQATKYDVDLSLYGTDTESNTIVVQSQRQESFDLSSFLQENLFGPTIAGMADQAVLSCGKPSLVHVNDALNAWYTTWQLRYFREAEHEERTFFQNPLPFWWLAKLYILLHLYKDLVGKDSEFAIFRAQNINGMSKLKVQTKIVRWFSRFRASYHYSEPLIPNLFPKHFLGPMWEDHGGLSPRFA